MDRSTVVKALFVLMLGVMVISCISLLMALIVSNPLVSLTLMAAVFITAVAIRAGYVYFDIKEI